MEKKRWQKILINGDINISKALSEKVLENHKLNVIKDPSMALTMVKIKEDTRGDKFYLGEVLITETKVKINNKLGLGIVIGINEELSKFLAIIDCGFQLGLNKKYDWDNILLKEEKRLLEKEKERQFIVNRTKVDFQTMSE